MEYNVVKNFNFLEYYEGHRKKINGVFETCPQQFYFTTEEDFWYLKTFKQLSPYSAWLEAHSNKNEMKIMNESKYLNKNKSLFLISMPYLEENIVIFTPISNAQNMLKHFFKLLCSLTYPHHLISIVFGEDSSIDNTYDEALGLAEKMEGSFRSIQVIRLQGNQFRPINFSRHDEFYQRFRRKHLAMARNQILMRGLKEENWVLWLDVDIKHIPKNLIEHLLSTNKNIVTVNILYKKSAEILETYDKNNWQETNESLLLQKLRPDSYLMLEGYKNNHRKFLNDLKYEDEKNDSKDNYDYSSKNFKEKINKNKTKANIMVKLDGVGGCVLLVKSELHRKGLNFPAFIYKNHIETEGLAKLASNVFNTKAFGLPHIYVIHW